jgi:hypothetical protein
MSAQDNLHPTQFYHGTAHPFQPGDVVEPGHSSNWGPLSRRDKVSGTTSRAEAHDYADHAQRMQSINGNRDARARVYKVTPIGETKPGATLHEVVASGFHVLDEGEPLMYKDQLQKLGIE